MSKKLMAEKTNNDYLEYVNSGEDAITLMDYKNHDKDTLKVLARFQTTADPKYMGECFDAFNGNNQDVFDNMPKYSYEGYSSFALRDKSLRLRYPLEGDLNSSSKYFKSNEAICPNFKRIVTKLSHAYLTGIFEDANIGSPMKVSFLGPIYISAKINGEYVSEADRLVLLINHFAKKATKRSRIPFYQQPYKNALDKTNNPERVRFATELLTTIFMCQALDMGAEFNRKVDHALRLQFANTIASLGNVSADQLNVISKYAEKATKKFLKKMDLDYQDIVKVRKNMGYEYKDGTPYDLHSALFGNVVNENVVNYVNEIKEKAIAEELARQAEKTVEDVIEVEVVGKEVEDIKEVESLPASENDQYVAFVAEQLRSTKRYSEHEISQATKHLKEQLERNQAKIKEDAEVSIVSAKELKNAPKVEMNHISSEAIKLEDDKREARYSLKKTLESVKDKKANDPSKFMDDILSESTGGYATSDYGKKVKAVVKKDTNPENKPPQHTSESKTYTVEMIQKAYDAIVNKVVSSKMRNAEENNKLAELLTGKKAPKQMIESKTRVQRKRTAFTDAVDARKELIIKHIFNGEESITVSKTPGALINGLAKSEGKRSEAVIIDKMLQDYMKSSSKKSNNQEK